jgi:penicillin-binding protein 1A
MTDILKDVITRGTGRNARVKGIELAGKTGTTNRGVDAWFCGYSPTVTTIVWYGRDNNRPIGNHATGGSVAAPAFADFYRALLTLYPNTPRHFEKPEGVMEGQIDGHRELYTAISPLPKIGEENPKGNIADMFAHTGEPLGSEENRSAVMGENPEPEESDMEVIRLDDTPIVEEPVTTSDGARKPAADPIDPLHLKPKRPKPVGDAGGAMF